MRQVELRTRDDGFVAVVEIPPYPDGKMPEGVVWGSRFFLKPCEDCDPVVHEDRWIYVEGFVAVSLTASPGLSRSPVVDSVPPLPPPPALPELPPGVAHDSMNAACPQNASTWGPTSDVRCKCPPPVNRAARKVIGEEVSPGVPNTEHKPNGQQRGYVVLSDEERARGFVRPVRRSYRHGKCRSTTSMGYALAETYARDPGFYSGTFCSTCRDHFPVGADGDFTWVVDGADTGLKVGT